MIHGNSENFQELIQGDYVLVDFFATWCGPCKMLSPVLENISNARSEVKIVKVDIDESMDLAREYGIMSVPTLILFKKGEKVAVKNGFMPEPLLTSWIEENK